MSRYRAYAAGTFCARAASGMFASDCTAPPADCTATVTQQNAADNASSGTCSTTARRTEIARRSGHTFHSSSASGSDTAIGFDSSAAAAAARPWPRTPPTAGPAVAARAYAAWAAIASR